MFLKLGIQQSLLILFVMYSAVPLASNRPFFWALNLLIAVLLAYSVSPKIIHDWRRFTPKPILILFSLLIVYGIVQCFPLSINSSVIVPANILPKSITIAVGPTVLAIARWLTYGLLFMTTIAFFRKTGRSRQALQILVVGIAFFAIYSLVALTQLGDPLLIFEKTGSKGVATGTFVNRNNFATFIAIGLVIAFSFILVDLQSQINRSKNNWSSLFSTSLWLNSACIGALFLALVMTESRMGVFAAGTGILVIAGLFLFKIEKHRWLLLSLFLIFLVAISISILTNVDTFLDRVLTVEKAAGSRMDAYILALNLIEDRPLIGFGAGTFELAFPLVRDYTLNPAFVWDKAHSTYLTLFVELGLFFGMIPILIVAILFKSSLAMYVTSSALSVRNLACIGAIIVVGVHSLVDFSIEVQAVTILFVFILAMGQTVRIKNVA
jgi:O-antigen ligase